MKFRDIITPSAILLLLGPLEHLDSKLSLKVIDILCRVIRQALLSFIFMTSTLIAHGNEQLMMKPSSCDRYMIMNWC